MSFLNTNAHSRHRQYIIDRYYNGDQPTIDSSKLDFTPYNSTNDNESPAPATPTPEKPRKRTMTGVLGAVLSLRKTPPSIRNLFTKSAQKPSEKTQSFSVPVILIRSIAEFLGMNLFEVPNGDIDDLYQNPNSEKEITFIGENDKKIILNKKSVMANGSKHLTPAQAFSMVHAASTRSKQGNFAIYVHSKNGQRREVSEYSKKNIYETFLLYRVAIASDIQPKNNEEILKLINASPENQELFRQIDATHTKFKTENTTNIDFQNIRCALKYIRYHSSQPTSPKNPSASAPAPTLA